MDFIGFGSSLVIIRGDRLGLSDVKVSMGTCCDDEMNTYDEKGKFSDQKDLLEFIILE